MAGRSRSENVERSRNRYDQTDAVMPPVLQIARVQQRVRPDQGRYRTLQIRPLEWMPSSSTGAHCPHRQRESSTPGGTFRPRRENRGGMGIGQRRAACRRIRGDHEFQPLDPLLINPSQLRRCGRNRRFSHRLLRTTWPSADRLHRQPAVEIDKIRLRRGRMRQPISATGLCHRLPTEARQKHDHSPNDSRNRDLWRRLGQS